MAVPPTTTTTATATATTSSSSTATILRQSLSHFLLSLPSLLLLSLLLLLLRSSLLAGNLRLSSLPSSHPLLHSLLSRLSSPPPPLFFHLPPPLPLADHFSSSPSFFPQSLLPIPSPNSSSPSTLTIRVRVTDPPQSPFSISDDAIQLIHLLSLLSSAHAAAILAFTLCYSTALGVVFLCVATNVLSRPVPSLISILRRGARLGLSRLVGSVFFKWAVRDAIVQILCILFFVNVEDQNKLFRLFVRVKLMPFSLTVLGWNEDDELPGFLILWGGLDFVVSMFLVFVPWVVVVDGDFGRNGHEAVTEGVFMVSLGGAQCVWVRCVEVVLSGRLGRLFFSAFGGRRFAMWAQAVLEVYFMVVWLVVYLEARRKDFELGGRRFGREELERCVDGF